MGCIRRLQWPITHDWKIRGLIPATNWKNYLSSLKTSKRCSKLRHWKLNLLTNTSRKYFFAHVHVLSYLSHRKFASRKREVAENLVKVKMSRCENRKLYTTCCVIKTAKNKLKNKSGIIHGFERSKNLLARKNGQGRLSWEMSLLFGS